jgi:hypothetical protein
MPNRLDKFVRDENLKHFGRQIDIETDPTRLAMLKALLKEEEVRGMIKVPRRPS